METATNSAETAALSVETLEQNFRTAVADYETAFNALKALVEAKAPEADLKPAVKTVTDADTAVAEALKPLLKVHKHGAMVAGYLDDGNDWGRRVAGVAAIGKDPLAPEFRRLSKGLFDEWKNSEQAYANAGYRTIPSNDWFDAMPREGVVPYKFWKLLFVEREPGEEPVLHALDMQRRHKGLRHQGANIKKLRRRKG